MMLKYLGPAAINYVTELFNEVIKSSNTPPIWKTGCIIPLLKPDKLSDERKRYRPVSLLSPLAKTLEVLLQPTILQSVNLANHQHGFRKSRSTVTAMHEITSHLKSGLNKNKPVDRSILVAVDLSCAFDTVNHEILLSDISNLQLDPHINKFLAGYLRGRKTFVEFRDQKSKQRKMRQGVPQGGVLSPLLFNLYMATIPLPPAPMRLVSYADDCSIIISGPKILPLCAELNAYLNTLNNWFIERNLHISPAKSSATVFTTFSNEISIQLPIYINNTLVPTEKHPKILGVTLDPLLNFGQHVKLTKDKVTKKNSVLKSLAGTSWGTSKETLLTTFKAISKSVLSYCSPIWSPSLSNTNWNELQIAQNNGLKTSLGCVKMSDVGHIHAESKMLPVKEHSDMLAN